MKSQERATLLIKCPDQEGLVAKVAGFVSENKGNIIDLDQHVDRQNKIFFMRLVWELGEFLIPREQIADYFGNMIGKPLQMDFKLHFSQDKLRMAIFVSKYSHCLFDILARVHSGELDVEVPLVISNHQDFEQDVKNFGLDFHHIPVSKDNKKEAEAAQLELLAQHKVDLVVLARYMQILSSDFVDQYEQRVINIHHSFLPAFPGSKPYHSAFERGVKIIGATSHYVTADLDEGPIIEQGVTHLNYKDDVQDMIRKGGIWKRSYWLGLFIVTPITMSSCMVKSDRHILDFDDIK